MRYWLMILALAFFVTAADSQDKKKKEDAGKETSKETGKDSKSPEFKEPSEIGGKSFEDWRDRKSVV